MERLKLKIKLTVDDLFNIFKVFLAIKRNNTRHLTFDYI